MSMDISIFMRIGLLKMLQSIVVTVSRFWPPASMSISIIILASILSAFSMFAIAAASGSDFPPPPLPPQAARLRTMHSAISSAASFFLCWFMINDPPC